MSASPPSPCEDDTEGLERDSGSYFSSENRLFIVEVGRVCGRDCARGGCQGALRCISKVRMSEAMMVVGRVDKQVG